MGRYDLIDVEINIRNKWTVVLFVNIDYDNYDIVVNALTNIDTPDDVISDIYSNIGYQYDSGFTFSNPSYRTSIVGINKSTSRFELINTIVHEIDHVQRDICEYYNIDLSSETAAYLIGYLAKMFYKVSSKLFCYY